MCTSLTDITLPDSIEVIGERAFAYSSICEITLPESLKVISRSAFGSCEKLTEVTIPQSVTTLSSQAFVFCTNLKAVYVKANILDLQAYTFYNSIVTDLNGNTYTNTALTQVYLPATLQKINSTALSGNFITDIYFAGSDEEWKEVYFYNITTADDGTTKEEVQDKDSLLSGVAVHTNYNF
jgi:hypothetical protein